MRCGEAEPNVPFTWVSEKGSLSIHYLEFPHNSSSR